MYSSLNKKGKYMNAEAVLHQIYTRELDVKRQIKHNSKFDIFMNTGAYHLEFAVLSLAISKVNQELEDAGVDIESFIDSIHEYINDIMVDSMKGQNQVKEFDPNNPKEVEVSRYSSILKTVNDNLLNRYYNALEEKRKKEEIGRKVVQIYKK
tara:strand:+ start:2458 stop:2913 length:456 start_codon:yes stop_codon:yes gene_type:complete